MQVARWAHNRAGILCFLSVFLSVCLTSPRWNTYFKDTYFKKSGVEKGIPPKEVVHIAYEISRQPIPRKWSFLWTFTCYWNPLSGGLRFLRTASLMLCLKGTFVLSSVLKSWLCILVFTKRLIPCRRPPDYLETNLWELFTYWPSIVLKIYNIWKAVWDVPLSCSFHSSPL